MCQQKSQGNRRAARGASECEVEVSVYVTVKVHLALMYKLQNRNGSE